MENRPKTSSGNPHAKILVVVTDDLEAVRVWISSLNQIGFDVILIRGGASILPVWSKEQPDLAVLIDFNEQLDNLQMCMGLREMTEMPLIVLSAKNSETFQLDAYRTGADEVIAFPITPRLFHAKLRSWLWRTSKRTGQGLGHTQALNNLRGNPEPAYSVSKAQAQHAPSNGAAGPGAGAALVAEAPGDVTEPPVTFDLDEIWAPVTAGSAPQPTPGLAPGIANQSGSGATAALNPWQELRNTSLLAPLPETSQEQGFPDPATPPVHEVTQPDVIPVTAPDQIRASIFPVNVLEEIYAQPDRRAGRQVRRHRGSSFQLSRKQWSMIGGVIAAEVLMVLLIIGIFLT